MAHKLSVLLPTKDRSAIFAKTYMRLVDVLDRYETGTVELIISNNADKPVALPEPRDYARVYDNPRNKNSVFSSRNFAASMATGDVLLFLDDDILVSPEAVAFCFVFPILHKHAAFNPNWVYPPELTAQIEKKPFGRFLISCGYSSRKRLSPQASWRDNALFEAPEIASFFFCITKADFERVGGYDETLPHEGSDVDISQRLHKSGIKIYTDSRLMVYHNEEDRMHIHPWLMRQLRAGQANRKAYDSGSAENLRMYSPLKKWLYFRIYDFRDLFIGLMNILPQGAAYDSVHFKIIHLLLGAHLCNGFWRKNA